MKGSATMTDINKEYEKEYYDEYRNKYYNPDNDDGEPGINLNWKRIQKGFHSVAAGDQETAETLSGMQANLETLNTDVETLNRDVETLQVDVEDIKEDIDSLNTDVDSLNTDVETLNTDVETLNTDVENLGTDVAGLQNTKIDKPNGEGGAGSVLTSDGNGGTSWSELGDIKNVDITVSNNKLVISSSGGQTDAGTWTLAKDITLNEEEIVNITTDSDGNNLQLKSARVLIIVPTTATYSGSRNFTCWYNTYNIGAAYAAAKTDSSLARLVFDLKQDHGFWDTECRGTMLSDSFTNIRASINNTNYFMFRDTATYKYITKITSDLAMPAGTQIKIWTIL